MITLKVTDGKVNKGYYRAPRWAQAIASDVFQYESVATVKFGKCITGSHNGVEVRHKDGSVATYYEHFVSSPNPDANVQANEVAMNMARRKSSGWITYSINLYDRAFTFINGHPIERNEF